MAFAKSKEEYSRLSRVPHSRAALGLAHALSDSQTREQIVPFGSSTLSGTAAPTYFDTLLNQEGCRDAWTKYTNVTTTTGFPQQLAQGKAPLNGFRHYTLQDAIYLEEYVRVRLDAIAAAGSKVSRGELLKFAGEIQGGIDYVTKTLATCKNRLGIPETTINTEWNTRSTELNKSIKHYNDVIQAAINKKDGSSWLDIHFALLPCIKGYYIIAKALDDSHATLKDTLYYSLWIKDNANDSYVKDYDSFIQNNTRTATKAQWENWGKIFKQSCDNEKAFFTLATDKSKYKEYDVAKDDDVVNTGTYTIHPYAKNASFLAPDGASGVTILDTGTATQWVLTNDKDGYSIALKGKNSFLRRNGEQVIIQTDQPTKWSINPASIGKKTYQLFVSGAMELALDTDISKKKVSMEKNKINVITQAWVLTASTMSKL